MSGLARRALLLRAGLTGVLVLMFFDLLEDVALYLAYVHAWWSAQQLGPWLSFFKMLSAALVAVPLAVAAVAVLTGWTVLRKTLASARAVLLIVGATVALVLFLRLGTEQVDDVVRAWTWPVGLAAALATLGAAALVLGVVRDLTDDAREQLKPNDGERDTQTLLLATCLGVAIVGGILPHWLGPRASGRRGDALRPLPRRELGAGRAGS